MTDVVSADMEHIRKELTPLSKDKMMHPRRTDSIIKTHTSSNGNVHHTEYDENGNMIRYECNIGIWIECDYNDDGEHICTRTWSGGVYHFPR